MDNRDFDYAMEIIKYQREEAESSKEKDHKIIKLLIKSLIISVLFNLVATIYWIYNCYLPAETSTSYDVSSEDDGNAIYNEDGKVNINGKSKGNKDN